MQMPKWLLPSQWAFAEQSGQGGSTHSLSSPHARWSGQSESVMHSERLDVAKWWIQIIKSVLLTNFAAFITWVASTDACVIACLTVSINCTIGTWVNTISIFSTCEVIRTTWVCYAFYTISIFSTCEVVRATWVLVQCYMVVKAGSLPMRTFYWIYHINCYQIKESFVFCTLP